MYTLGVKELCLIMVANRTLTIGCSLLSVVDAQVGVHGWRFVNYSQELRKIFSNRCQKHEAAGGPKPGFYKGPRGGPTRGPREVARGPREAVVSIATRRCETTLEKHNHAYRSRAWRFSWVFMVATQLAPKLYFGIPMCLPE